MTGRYAFRTGLYNTRFGGDSLSLREVTVAQLLRQAGYRTGLFGKSAFGACARACRMNGVGANACAADRAIK